MAKMAKQRKPVPKAKVENTASILTGAFGGASLGAIGGPIGFAVGGAAGAILGNKIRSEDNRTNHRKFEDYVARTERKKNPGCTIEQQASTGKSSHCKKTERVN